MGTADGFRFRALTESDVEVRVQQCSEKGVSLLLYKNARCDMRILDETVGPLNWQRTHSRDNANCTVSIWDEQKQQWISKEDTGSQSNTEAEKGLCSDSFKRACTCWGIGRELYTAPFIWIPASKCTLEQTGRKDQHGKPVLKCKSDFRVMHMSVADGAIVSLSISADGKEAFRWEANRPMQALRTPQEELICSSCGKPIRKAIHKGKEYTPAQITEMTRQEYGRAVCWSCARKLKEMQQDA